MPRLSKAEKERCRREILEIEQAKIKPYLDRIAELEKENAELKRHIKADCIDCADYYKNKRLEKENAELKELKKKKEEIEIMTNFCKACKKMHTDNLTKAKEIIKKMIEAIHIWDCKNLEEVEAEAEQFLSEVEK